MEEKKKYEELKLILDSIQKTIALYNDLNPAEKLVITPQKKYDVSDIFICVYNDNHIGLFKKINWYVNKPFLFTGNNYDAGYIYDGINTNYIGMKRLHKDSYYVNYWEDPGTLIECEDNTYIVNCNIKNDISFDDMRFIMYNNGQIKPYEIGVASSQELIDVLKYASNYYNLNQNVQKQKRR